MSKAKFSVLWAEQANLFTSIYNGGIKGYPDGLIDKVKVASENYTYLFRTKYKEKINNKSLTESRDYFRMIEENVQNKIIELKDKTYDLIDYEKLDIKFEPLTDFKAEDIQLQFQLKIM